MLYNYLLELKPQDEIVKECMIKWAQNVGHTINLKSWSQIWEGNIKLTKAIN